MRFVVVVTMLAALVVTVPLAVWYAVSRSFAVPFVMQHPVDAASALRRSGQATRGVWWRTARVLGLVFGVGALSGPLLGVGLLFLTGMSVAWVNAVSSLVYVVTVPFVAAALVYLHEDLLARGGAALQKPGGGAGGGAGREGQRSQERALDGERAPSAP